MREVLQVGRSIWPPKPAEDRVRLWVYLPAVAAVVEELGFTLERELLQMRLPLPPQQSPCTADRSAPRPLPGRYRRGGLDRVNNRAFAGHPENGSWTRSILAERMRQDWFDPEGVSARLAGERGWPVSAGPSSTRSSVGEIYVIAVDPDDRGRSLGTWLTLEGFVVPV